MDKNIANEAGLLQASIDGNSAAFESIVRKYQNLICAITYSATSSVEKSEELAQETFVRAWKNLKQLRDPGSFKSWLCTIAKTAVKNHFRSQKRDLLRNADSLDNAAAEPSDTTDPADKLISMEEQAVVAKALQNIPESYRQPLILFYRQEKSIKQVADMLELSEDNVRTRLSRGRKMLKHQVVAMVEKTLAGTAPSKAFTIAVMASVAAIAMKTSGVAVAADIATTTSATSAAASATTVMSAITAKIITAAAVIVIAVAAVVTYKQITKPDHTPPSSPPAIAAEKEQDTKPINAQNKAVEKAVSKTIQIPAKTITPPVADVVDTPPGQTEEIKPPAITIEPVIAAKDKYKFVPKGVLSGLITDIETGQPVTDATVKISKGRIYSAKTDEHGFYFFKEIKSNGNHDISIHSNEYIGIAVYNDSPVVELKKNSQVVKHFKFPKACMLNVWVVDEDGKGIKGARVVATSPSDSRSKDINRTGSAYETDENGYILLGGFTPARTDYLITTFHKLDTKTKLEDGSIHRQSEYDYSLGHAIVKLTDPNVIELAEIVLKKGMKIKGYAQYSDGVDATDIKVIAKPAWWHCNYGVSGYQVDDGGNFELEYIVPGTYNISAYTANPDGSGGSSYVVMQAKLPLPEGELLHVQVPEKSPGSLVSLAGTLTYIGEKKHGSISINAYSPIHGHRSIDVWNSNDKLENDFLINRLEPGKYTVRFSGSNIEEVVMENIEVPGDDIHVELVYVGKPKIECMAVDFATGEVIKKFRARVKKTRTLRGPNYVQEDKWYYLSGKEGLFEVEVVGPGIYHVQVKAEGYAPKWSGNINTDKPEMALVELTKGGTISGKVINEKGEEISGAIVMALSSCSGSMPRTHNTFTNQQYAVETVKGVFALKNLPIGMETLKVVHPDYTPTTIEEIEIVEGKTTENFQIVLTKGATVEGYVYDSDGKPEEGVVVIFQDAIAYVGSGDEEAGKYGTDVTDSKGFYSVSRLPESMCYVKRRDVWESLGVVRQTVVPKNNEKTRLDFGGKQILSGTAVIDGTPLSEVTVQLGSVGSPHFGNYRCNSRTDLDGNFLFRGVIEGKYAIYYQNPEKRNDWIKLSNVDIQTEDIDVGVIPDSISDLVLTIDESCFNKKRVVMQVYLSNSEKIFGQPIHISTKRKEKDGLWIIKGVEPGDYFMCIMFSDQMQMRQPISLSEDQSKWEIKVDLPKSTSNVSGTILGDISQGFGVWKEDASILITIRPDSKGTFKIESLPTGKYMVGSYMNLLNGKPGFSQFELHDGKDLTLNFDLSENAPDKMGYLQVQVIDDQGKPRTDIDIKLISDTATTEPIQSSTNTGHIFVSPPGEYILSILADGYKTIAKDVKLKVYEEGSARPKTTVVKLEKK